MRVRDRGALSGSPDGWGNLTTKLVLPDPVDPDEFVCYLVRVPKSKYHIMAFLGAIYDLSLWWNWQRDDAHTASLVAQVWRKIWRGLRPSPCEPIEPGASTGCDCEDDCMGCCEKFINGVLSQKDCDGNWIAVPGQNTSGPSSSGPAPQPPSGGGQQAYDNCLQANQQKPLPTTVSSADTISVEAFSGAWNDPGNDLLTWRGPNGQVYFAGAYLPGTQELVGTDPLPTAPHMSLIALINGVYYPLFGATLTIPGGISNAQVILQANDSNLSDDQGDVCVTLNVVNNSLATFTHTFDYSLSAFLVDWHAVNNPGETPSDNALYTTTYTDVRNINNAAPNVSVRQCSIESTVPAHVTRVRAFITYVAGGNTNGVIDSGFISVNGTLYDQTAHPAVPASPIDTGPIDVMAVNIQVNLTCGLNNLTADPGGSAAILKVIIDGLGADPY